MQAELLVMLQEVLVNAILGIMIVLLGFALSYIKVWIQSLKAKLQTIKDEKARAIAKDALDKVMMLTQTTVAAIEEKIAKDLRKEVKDGKLSKETLNMLSVQAYLEIKSMLKPQCEQVLNETIGNVDKYIQSLIEVKLKELKLNQLQVVSVPVREGGKASGH